MSDFYKSNAQKKRILKLFDEEELARVRDGVWVGWDTILETADWLTKCRAILKLMDEWDIKPSDLESYDNIFVNQEHSK